MALSTNLEVSILACPYDVGFLSQTVPHIVKSLGGLGTTRTLLVDWMPASGYYSSVYPERQETQFVEICNQLVADGWIDKVVKIPYEKQLVSLFLKDKFKGKFNATHDIRGYPIYGSIYPLFTTNAKYFLHFDSDMFMYQSSGDNWIELGIDLLKQCPNILSVMPLAGPPTTDGVIYQGNQEYCHDSRGFFTFKSFTSRVFLMDVDRFRRLHPLSPLWLGRKDVLRSFWDGNGRALSWESIMTNVMYEQGLSRADLASKSAWSLHPPSKDKSYLANLKDIISCIESGSYPMAQAGHYDLILSDWAEFLDVPN